MADKKTYILGFKCNNCFHKFTKAIPWGKEVKHYPYGWSRELRIIETEPPYNGDYIICPNCGSGDVIKDREFAG